jgi:hypothetical protein
MTFRLSRIIKVNLISILKCLASLINQVSQIFKNVNLANLKSDKIRRAITIIIAKIILYAGIFTAYRVISWYIF